MQRKKSRKAKSGWRARVRRCNVIAGNRNGYNAVDTFAINPQGSKRLEPIICEVRNEQRTRRQVAISRNIRTEDSIDGLGESSGTNDRSLGIGLAVSATRSIARPNYTPDLFDRGVRVVVEWMSRLAAG